MDYKLILFDIDGTLVETASGETFRKSADDWKYLPGRVEKCKQLWQSGVKVALVSNQGGVAFGLLDPHEIRHELTKTAEGVHAAYVAMCFSHPKAKIEQFREDSSRRKPGPGMLLEAIEASGEKKQDVLMVGDRSEDEQAAQSAGVAFMWADEYFK
jgi:D-glycero-D-manno-heptose 1,7-bisphosphate phosphatase